MIHTRDLGKLFLPLPWPLSLAGRHLDKTVRALHHVSLDVGRGEIFGLLGPNGAGKTTLLRILCTLLLPSAGAAHVCGRDVVRDAAAVRRVVGVASGDEKGFYWRLTGRENLEFFAGLRGLAPAEARRRARHVLELVDLGGVREEPVTRYTTGMRQRLGVARALLGRPQVLLLDEPTRSLDPVAADVVRGLIRRLADEGATVLLATHNLSEAGGLCSRVAVLATGTVRAVIPASSDGSLEDRYLALLGASE